MLGYSEKKPRRAFQVIWRGINASLFRILGGKVGWSLRRLLLKAFGAKLGRHCYIYSRCIIFAPWHLEVGAEVCIGPRTRLYNKGMVRIGARTVISQDSSILTASHDTSSLLLPPVVKPVTIGEDCWIAAEAMIAPGVTIGDGAIVSARAAVFEDVEPYTIVRGNPAVAIRKRVIRK